MVEVSYLVAFAAGIVSFLAPCVLPLVPGFLAYLAGTTVTGGAVEAMGYLSSQSLICCRVLPCFCTSSASCSTQS